MEFTEVINKRYSVRGFKNQEIEEEKLNKILEAARTAPTGVNFQPFQIYVIDTQKNKEQLSKVYPQPWFTQAPLILAVTASPSKAWTRKFDNKNIADIDATIIMDHIILEATNQGLGTCYIGAFNPEEAKKLLKPEEDYEPILFTPLGYIDAEPRDTPRKPLKELVKYI